jgi:hypothetical protein
VEEWYLSASEGYKGCEISPDGALVAYWTDVKISLFTSQSLPSGERNVVTAAAEYVLEITDCIWKSVSLTQRYLIASTTGANFQVRTHISKMFKYSHRYPSTFTFLSPFNKPSNITCSVTSLISNEVPQSMPASTIGTALSCHSPK